MIEDYVVVISYELTFETVAVKNKFRNKIVA